MVQPPTCNPSACSRVTSEGVQGEGSWSDLTGLYEYMDPSSDNMPYIFADFDWSHCSDLGIDFGQMQMGDQLNDDIVNKRDAKPRGG
jgi:hypothetical protein